MQPNAVPVTGGPTSGVGIGVATQGGVGMATPGVGMATPGVGMATPGVGMATPGVGMATPGVGMATPGVGMATPGVGMATPGAGMATPGVGMATPGVGMATPGVGMATPGVGMASPGGIGTPGVGGAGMAAPGGVGVGGVGGVGGVVGAINFQTNPAIPPSYPKFLEDIIPPFLLHYMYITSIISLWGFFIALTNIKLKPATLNQKTTNFEILPFSIHIFFVILLASSSKPQDPLISPLSWIFLLCTVINQLLDYMEKFKIGIIDMPLFSVYSPRMRQLTAAATNLIALFVSGSLFLPSSVSAPVTFHNIPTHLVGLYGLWQCFLSVHLPSHLSKFEERYRVQREVRKKIQEKQDETEDRKGELREPTGSTEATSRKLTEEEKEKKVDIRKPQAFLQLEPYSMFLYLLISSLTTINTITRLLTLLFFFGDVAIMVGKKIGKPLPVGSIFNLVSVMVGMLTSVWILSEVSVRGDFPISGKLVALYGMRELVACLPDIPEGGINWKASAPLKGMKINQFSRELFMLMILVAANPQMVVNDGMAGGVRIEEAQTSSDTFGGLQVIWFVCWSFFALGILTEVVERMKEWQVSQMALNALQDLFNLVGCLLGLVASLWIMIFC